MPKNPRRKADLARRMPQHMHTSNDILSGLGAEVHFARKKPKTGSQLACQESRLTTFRRCRQSRYGGHSTGVPTLRKTMPIGVCGETRVSLGGFKGGLHPYPSALAAIRILGWERHLPMLSSGGPLTRRETLWVSELKATVSVRSTCRTTSSGAHRRSDRWSILA